MDARMMFFIIVMIPLLSICLGVTVRFAIKPLMESLLDAIHELGRITSGGGVAPDRVQRLEAEITQMREEMRRLTTAVSSDRTLADPNKR